MDQLRALHFGCVNNDGNLATLKITFGPNAVALAPHVTFGDGDLIYADQIYKGTNGYPDSPALTKNFTQDDYKAKFRNLFNVPGMRPILTLPNFRWLLSDHDTADNDYDHSYLSTAAGTNCLNQDECNTKNAAMMTFYKSITKNAAATMNAFDPLNRYDNIYNPDNIDPEAVPQIPAWVSNTVLKADGTPDPNPTYTSTPDATANHPVNYWREGWTFKGVMNPPTELATNKIAFFCLDDIMHRDRLPEFWGIDVAPEDTINPYMTRALRGTVQVAWLKNRITKQLLANPDCYIAIICDKIMEQLGSNGSNFLTTTVGSPNNKDGVLNYQVETNDLLSWLATNVTKNLIILASDTHLPHVINYAPGDDARFPNGFAQVCSSPLTMAIFQGWFTSNAVKVSRRNRCYTLLTADETGMTVTMYNAQDNYPMCICFMPKGKNYFTRITDGVGYPMPADHSIVGYKL